MSRFPAPVPSDDHLVELARLGDRDALDRLLRRYHDRVHLLCRRVCRDHQDADDATQEALIAVVRGLPRFDGRSAFSTWVYRVTTNSCLDELRRRRRRPEPTATDDHPERVSGTEDPADGAVRSDTRHRLLRALADLPEEFRFPVVLRDVCDLDYATIAQILEIAPGTVRSRISRGRSTLARSLPGDAPVRTGDDRGNHPDHGTVEPPTDPVSTGLESPVNDGPPLP